MLITFISVSEYENATIVASVGLIVVLIIWNLVNSKEKPIQGRLNARVEVFIIPLLIMFIYLMINRNLRITLG